MTAKVRRKIKWAVLVVCLLVGVGALASRAQKGRATGKADSALTATVRRADLEVTVLETGRIEPRAQAQVKSRVGGQVTEVTVQEGEKVRVGQVLLRLEPTDYQRDVARATLPISRRARAAAASWRA